MKTKEEIKQLAETEYGTEIGSIRGSNPYDLEADRKNGYIKGYTQCQNDMDKKYTEEDIRKVIDETIKACNISQKESYGDLEIDTDKIINSLNKQD